MQNQPHRSQTVGKGLDASPVQGGFPETFPDRSPASSDPSTPRNCGSVLIKAWSCVEHIILWLYNQVNRTALLGAWSRSEATEIGGYGSVKPLWHAVMTLLKCSREVGLQSTFFSLAKRS